MSKLKIYTKTGDRGETSLVGGQRVRKDVERIDLYGDVDELNSHIGVLSTSLEDKNKDSVKLDLEKIQSDLFCLGSALASEPEDREKYKLPLLGSEHLKFLEDKIDEMSSGLPELKNFILPGGSVQGAQTHVCRTVCRRCERKVVKFQSSVEDHHLEAALMFLNRLSDYFFVLGRYLNQLNNCSEKIWKI